MGYWGSVGNASCRVAAIFGAKAGWASSEKRVGVSRPKLGDHALRGKQLATSAASSLVAHRLKPAVAVDVAALFSAAVRNPLTNAAAVGRTATLKKNRPPAARSMDSCQTKRSAPTKLAQPAKAKGRAVVSAAGDVAMDDGSVWETDAQHAARHPKWDEQCTRCRYTKYRSVLERRCSLPPAAAARKQSLTTWLVPRPACLGGEFRLGCCVCAGASLQGKPSAEN